MTDMAAPATSMAALIGSDVLVPAVASTAVQPAAGARPTYPPASVIPTQEGPLGLRFDFNQGARVLLPERGAGTWRVRLSDRDTGNVLFESQSLGAIVRSSKRFYAP